MELHDPPTVPVGDHPLVNDIRCDVISRKHIWVTPSQGRIQNYLKGDSKFLRVFEFIVTIRS